MSSDRPPDWVKDAVFYQIFPDRFARSGRTPQPAGLEPWDSPPTVHGYKGGDLDGIADHLDWLTDLGITALYLNPIFASASNHRYHTHDYYKIDPLLGDDDAFDGFLTACHGRGIRVVLDGVFNHVGRGFLPFNDLLENGESSPWRDWFSVRDWPFNAYDHDTAPAYEAWWGMHALPKLNTDNAYVREYLMRVAEHWIRRGIDGWRLDVPAEIRTVGFWEEFRERVRALNPEAYLAGEFWGDATEWCARGDRFDATMNYLFTENAIAFAIGDRVDEVVVEPAAYTVSPPIDGTGYRERTEALLGLYPDAVTLANLNLLGSHDTPRIRSVASKRSDSVVLGHLLMLTFPGAPCIYYGDEIGMLGHHDPGSRGTFPWDRPGEWDVEILEATRALVQLRHRHEELRSIHYESLWPEDGPGPMHVFRRGERPGIVVAVNPGDSEAAANPDVADLELLWGSGELHDGMLVVPGRSGAVWRET